MCGGSCRKLIEAGDSGKAYLCYYCTDTTLCSDCYDKRIDEAERSIWRMKCLPYHAHIEFQLQKPSLSRLGEAAPCRPQEREDERNSQPVNRVLFKKPSTGGWSDSTPRPLESSRDIDWDNTQPESKEEKTKRSKTERLRSMWHDKHWNRHRTNDQTPITPPEPETRPPKRTYQEDTEHNERSKRARLTEGHGHGHGCSHPSNSEALASPPETPKESRKRPILDVEDSPSQTPDEQYFKQPSKALKLNDQHIVNNWISHLKQKWQETWGAYVKDVISNKDQHRNFY
jgi:hypothetical protein